MFETMLTAATYAPYGYCVWDFYSRGQSLIPNLVREGAWSLLSSGIEMTGLGSTPVSPKWMDYFLNQAESWGRKNVEKATDLRSLFPPLEYFKTATTLTARKVFFYLNGKSVTQKLCQSGASTIQGLAKKHRLSTDETYLGTLKEFVQTALMKRGGSDDLPSLSKRELTFFSTQVLLETALPWLVRWYVVSTFAEAVIPEGYTTLATIACLGLYTFRLMPTLRKEFSTLGSPKSQSLNLLNDETIGGIIVEAKRLFRLNDDDNEDKRKIGAFEQELKSKAAQIGSYNPFVSLESTTPSPLVNDGQASGIKARAGKLLKGACLKCLPGWVSYLFGLKAEEPTIAEEQLELEKLRLEKEYFAEGTPERTTAYIKQQAKAKAIAIRQKDPVSECHAWIQIITHKTHQIRKQVGGDVDGYLKTESEKVNKALQKAASDQLWDRGKELNRVKDKIAELQTEIANPAPSQPNPPRTPAQVRPAQTPPATRHVRQAVGAAQAALTPEQNQAPPSPYKARQVPPMQPLSPAADQDDAAGVGDIPADDGT